MYELIKVRSNKEGPKSFLAAPFFESFFPAASCKKGLKKQCSRKIFDPSTSMVITAF